MTPYPLKDCVVIELNEMFTCKLQGLGCVGDTHFLFQGTVLVFV